MVMKMANNFIYYVSIMICAVLLNACTILDNDLRELPDAPGYANMEHEETETYTCDYQYNPDVTLIDEDMMNYVAHMDSAYNTIYFHDYMPDGVRPEVGQILIAGYDEKIPYGLGHRVVAVSKHDTFYACSLEKAAVDDIFKNIIFETKNGDDETTSDSAMLAPGRKKANENEPINKVFEDDLTLTFSIPLSGGISNDFARLKGVTFSGSANGSLTFTIGPGYKTKVYYKKLETDSEEQFDISFALTFTDNEKYDVSGSIDIAVDICEALNLKLPSIGPIGPPGFMLYFRFTPTASLGMNVSGMINSAYDNKYTTGLGFRKNMSGLQDGPYVIDNFNQIKPAQSDTERSEWTGKMYAYGEIGLDIGFNSPGAGCYFKVKLGPSMSVSSSSKNGEDKYNMTLSSAVDLTPEGGLYADKLWGGTARWDILSAIISYFKTDALPVQFLKTSWPCYPKIADYAVLCYDKGGDGKLPKFMTQFRVTDKGVFTPSNTYVYPVMTIYHNSQDRPMAHNKFNPIFTSSAPFDWEFGGDPPFAYDDVYRAELSMQYQDKDNNTQTLWKKKTLFTAVSPSAIINGWQVYKAYWTKDPKSTIDKLIANYEFYTDITVNGEKDILNRWGLAIGDKEYAVPQDFWKAGNYRVKWKATKKTGFAGELTAVKNADRRIEMDVFIYDNQNMRVNPVSEVINLKWEGEKDLNPEDMTGTLEEVDMTGKSFAPQRTNHNVNADVNNTPDDFQLEIESIEPIN